jgi:prolyl oligopeptidase
VAGLFCQLYEDAVSVVKQYDYSGKMLREIELPEDLQVGLVVRKEETLYYSFTITRRRNYLFI